MVHASKHESEVIYIYSYINTHTHIYMHIYIYTHTCIYMNWCINYKYMLLLIYIININKICMCVCTHVYVCVWCMNVCIYVWYGAFPQIKKKLPFILNRLSGTSSHKTPNLFLSSADICVALVLNYGINIQRCRDMSTHHLTMNCIP